MGYTNRTVVVSQKLIVQAEVRVSRQRNTVQKLEDSRHPAATAVALLLVMEQSLISMRRFLATVERNLELSLDQDKPKRGKRVRPGAAADVAHEVVHALESGGLEAEIVDVESSEQLADRFAASALNYALAPAPDGLDVLAELARKSKTKT